MMRGRALRLGPEGVTGLGQTGRTFSRTGCCDMATLKPMTPLQPLMQASMKPPSPMLTPEQQPLKQPSPLQPNNTPKTPVSHPQRRWRFQPQAHTSKQRRHRFHARDLRRPRAIGGPDQRTFACNSAADTSCVSMQSLKFQAFCGVIDDRRQGIACEIAKQ